MLISSDIDFFDTVYLKTDTDQCPRLVTEVKLLPPNTMIFALSCGTVCTWHYRTEFTIEKDEVKIITR